MQSSQTIQPGSSGKARGEMLPNAAIAGLNIPSIPGFSQEQNISLHGLMTAFQIAMDRAFDQSFDRFTAKLDRRFKRLERHFGPLQQPTSTPTPIPTPLTSPAKKKRNQKTRQQYKKKAQAQRVTIIQVQEVDRSQEVEHSVQSSVEKASKHVVLQSWDWVATSPQHAAVIPFVGMASFGGMITVLNGAICMPRIGVG